MKLENLRAADVVDRWRDDEPPMVFVRRTGTTVPDGYGNHLHTHYCYVFRDLETWEEVLIFDSHRDDVQRSKRWELLERLLPADPSGSVDSDAGSQNGLTTKRKK